MRRRVPASWIASPTADEALLAVLAPLGVPVGRDDRRSGPQRRHDALEQLCLRSLDGGGLPEHGGQRPHVAVHVDLAQLQARSGLATTTWTGPIGASEAHFLTCDAAVSRVVLDRPACDSLSALIADQIPATLGGTAREIFDVGRETRVISAPLRRPLVARDRGCTHPGCTVPPAYCQGHHLVHWARGGPTNAENIRLLCHRHHCSSHRHGPPPDA